MSAGEVVQKEQGKKQGKEPQRDCWICLDDGPDESGERPQPTGCACRGGATTHAHVACLAKFAREKAETWLRCPTCGFMICVTASPRLPLHSTFRWRQSASYSATRFRKQLRGTHIWLTRRLRRALIASAPISQVQWGWLHDPVRP